jgi:hypothetical protein
VKTSPHAQSATSLPQAPRDDAGSRITKYLVMMGIRLACFVAMALVTPYGWYTFVFAAGAIFLPYLRHDAYSAWRDFLFIGEGAAASGA